MMRRQSTVTNLSPFPNLSTSFLSPRKPFSPGHCKAEGIAREKALRWGLSGETPQKNIPREVQEQVRGLRKL